jgi:uncharacterized protein YegL
MQLNVAASANVESQLGLLIDGSGSIGPANFDNMSKSLADAINQSLPKDGSIELTVVRFASSAQVIIENVIITNETVAQTCGAIVRNMQYTGGGTDLAAGLDKIAETMAKDLKPEAKQHIDLITDGEPNSQPDAMTSRNNLLNTLQMTNATDRITAEGVGSATNSQTLKDNLIQLVWPEVGVLLDPSQGSVTFPPDKGWVLLIRNWSDIDQAIKQKFAQIVSLLDFGDAPDPYHTLLASNGASHEIDPRVYLGATVDSEVDGQPTQVADGDDINNDDEDGVVFGLLTQGSTSGVQVTASVAGMLNAWIDFNGNGNWADADEQIFTDEILVAGVNNLNFDVPSGAAEGDTYARFRFNTQGGLPFNGSAADGEVEDYVIKIEASTPPEPEPEPEPIESQPDRNFDSLEVGSDSAIAMNSFMGPRLKTLATNNLEIKKNQDSGACPDDCCDPWIKSVGPDGTVESHDCKDCCTKYNRDTIKVGSRDAIAFGMASATNNVKVVAEQK